MYNHYWKFHFSFRLKIWYYACCVSVPLCAFMIQSNLLIKEDFKKFPLPFIYLFCYVISNSTFQLRLRKHPMLTEFEPTTCMYVCMYVRTYVRMYVCMYVCVHTEFAHRGSVKMSHVIQYRGLLFQMNVISIYNQY